MTAEQRFERDYEYACEMFGWWRAERYDLLESSAKFWRIYFRFWR